MDRSTLGAMQRLENLKSKALSQSMNGDTELQAEMARFLCVLASGLIEQILILGLTRMVTRRSIPSISNYASHHISRINNAKFEDILVNLGRFESKWREHFETSTDQEVKDAVDSIVNNRNQISHGKQVGISIVTFGQYYKSLKPFLLDLDAFLDRQ